jgi:hypothetical protein
MQKFLRSTGGAIVLALSLASATATVATAMSLGPWTPATSAEFISSTSAALNTEGLEGCPFVAQRDDVLYFTSNRAGGLGGLDIWYSVREEDGAWADPVNFTAVNSAANELCPMAHRNGRTFLFVSNRTGGCGGDDLYATRLHTRHGWAVPANLGCSVNSVANEASPSLLDTELYFSSTRAGGLGGSDLYISSFDGVGFGAPSLVPFLNSTNDDFRPNLRRDGLEIFFDSNRSGGFGMLDLWSATRATTSDPWSAPTNLGSNVNSTANDLRASVSWDARTLYFGSTRTNGEGSQDLYASTR